MDIIKVNAIESTSTFLKELMTTGPIKNYTVVSAKSQFGGRGQMGSKWVSDPGKNLLFSMYVEGFGMFVKDAMYLNIAISNAIYNALLPLKIPNLKIKWPNDILAGGKKICGILVENTIQKNVIKSTIIGVGLNVNQELFPLELKNASSLKNVLGKSINQSILLNSIVVNITEELELCTSNNFQTLKETYLSNMFKLQTPCMFKNDTLGDFMGKIVGVNTTGKLLIELEDESIKEFGLKEVAFLS
jgi:BirA family biotin operon repressor/biotin-[acetyl-CoA-carboxylase] ligase